MTFRTVFRETLSSRQIALIDFPCTKNARRIFAIVSTISIPISAPMNHGSHCGPAAPGSRLDADHPENGVLIPCRNTIGGLRGLREKCADGSFRNPKALLLGESAGQVRRRNQG